MKEDTSTNLRQVIPWTLFTGKMILPLFLIIVFCSMTNNLHAQDMRLNLKLENTTLLDAIKQISTTTGMEFFYNTGQVKAYDKRISKEFSDTPLTQVLDFLLDKTPFTYKLEDKTIVIIQRPVQANTPQIKLIELKGVVFDKDTREPLPGVTVMIEGSQQGTATNANGEFIFPIDSGNYNIIFSFIGYERLVKKFNGNNSAEFREIQLAPAVETIEDVVVTGIYRRKKESFTGSASTYKVEDLKAAGTQNVLQSIRTLDPSFKINVNNQFGSDPNRLPDVEIRGKSSVMGLKEEYGTDPNQPLFILDGFETDLQTVMDLNMNRVASVTLLKDAASTAIYGSRAANGVLVIETKVPEKGVLSLSYKGDFSITMADLSDYNLMNAREKLEFETRAGRYTSTTNDPMDQIAMDNLRNQRLQEIERGVNTYWLSEPIRTGFVQKHNLYAEGGEERIRYGLGLSYGNTQGVMKGSDRQTISGNIDLVYRTGKFQFSNKFILDYMKTNNPAVPFSEYAKANPYFRKYNSEGGIDKYLYYTEDPEEYSVPNPLWNAHLNNYDVQDQFGFTNNFILEWFATNDLRARAKFGISKNSSTAEVRLSPQHSDFDEMSETEKGLYTNAQTKNLNYEGDISVTYGHLFAGKHMINAVAGFNFNTKENSKNGYKAIGFTEDEFDAPSFTNSYPAGSKPTYTESKTRAASFYINGGYAYDNRYLFDFNYRSDGTSVFGTNNRFRNTWSVGLGWNIHAEKFMENCDFFQLLKLRGSVGNPGNQNFASYQAFSTYAFTHWMSNIFGTGVILEGLGNPDLAWQETINYSLGTDVTMFNERVNLTIDLYRKKTDPLVAAITTPSSIGVKSVMMNMGQLKTDGIEVTLKVSPIYRPQDRFVWNISLNGTHAKSKYSKIGNRLQSMNEQNQANLNTTRYYDGGSPTDIWAVRSAGIDPATGQDLFIKKDGTYTFTYDKNDEVVVGNTEPKLEGVLGTTLYYKGLSFGCYLRYRLGGQVFNNALYEKVENIDREGINYNQDKRALYDRWSTPGQEAKFKRISLFQTTETSSRFVMDENTLSGESFNIGYEFTQPFIKHIGLSTLTVQANMNDIFRVSSVKSERGIDYPFARTMSFSISATF